jgi:hypothetical protein
VDNPNSIQGYRLPFVQLEFVSSVVRTHWWESSTVNGERLSDLFGHFFIFYHRSRDRTVKYKCKLRRRKLQGCTCILYILYSSGVNKYRSTYCGGVIFLKSYW